MNTILCKILLSPDRKTIRKVYYHPKTKRQVAILTDYYHIKFYYVSFPIESSKAFTFKVGSLWSAEKFIKREYTIFGKWLNRIIATLANKRVKLPEYYHG